MKFAIALVLVACGDNTERPKLDVAIERFAEIACGGECVADEAACREQVFANMEMAKKLLTDQLAKDRCAYCLDTKADIIPEVSACHANAEQNARVYEACDLDPTMDFDRDGESANDTDEACAGFP